MNADAFIILWFALVASISAFAYYQAIQGLRRGWIRRSVFGGKIKRDEKYGFFRLGVAFLFIVGTVGIAMLICAIKLTKG